MAAMTIRKTASSLKKMRFFTCSFRTISSSGSFPSFRGLETVAGAANGFQIARVLRVRLDFFADAANIDVDRARGHVGGIAPDGIEQVIAAENASLMAGKVIEQAKLRGRGGNQLPANREGHGRGIDFDLADFHRAGRQAAAQSGAARPSRGLRVRAG